jgi:regulator of sirC expression with transglutaminase-like and TPR domain
MFFIRLRKQARWMFVFIALAFAASTVLFGVGTGFGGLQDVLLQDRTIDGTRSASEARAAIEENANDAEAHRDLSTALVNEGDLDGAITALARYVELRPNDHDAQRELAGLYLRRAEQFRRQAQNAQAMLAREVPGRTFQPPATSNIGQALQNDPIQSALAAQYEEQLTQAFTRMQEAYSNAVDVYRGLAEALPNDAPIQLELAQTAEAANDLQTAITAYERFLELAPEDPSAEAVKQRIELLQGAMAGPEDG